MIAELLDTLDRNIPDLHGAACSGHAALFDVADRHDTQAITAAKAVCVSCPVLDSCRSWLASLPRPARPCGVVAGRYVAPPRLPPAYEPRPRGPSSRDRAAAWLRGYMAQRGPVASAEVIGAAAAAGIGRSALYGARVELGVRLQRVPGAGGRHTWS